MRRGADIIVNIDGDGQFNPADIAQLVQPDPRGRGRLRHLLALRRPRALARRCRTVKYCGNRVVTRIINWVCGGTSFTDVSCGFRAFNREAAYRLTLFGRFTYTQETFIDLFSKGLRIAEVPLHVRGVREHGKSRVASSIFKYATNSLPIILRAMRDIQPLKFFGGIALLLFIPGVLTGGVRHRLLPASKRKTTPFTSLITISGVLITLSFLLGVLALLADMLGRHRKISEELLYLARRKIYAGKRTPPARSWRRSSRPARWRRLFEESWGIESPEQDEGLAARRHARGQPARPAPATSHDPTRCSGPARVLRLRIPLRRRRDTPGRKTHLALRCDI